MLTLAEYKLDFSTGKLAFLGVLAVEGVKDVSQRKKRARIPAWPVRLVMSGLIAILTLTYTYPARSIETPRVMNFPAESGFFSSILFTTSEGEHYTPPKRSTKIVVTPYNSIPEQTDSTPFITATGTTVRDGVIASNYLPIGTKVRFPDLFGSKVFVVEDRMNQRYHKRIDIWSEDVQFS